jgi:CheY-like chemotaxis protein
MNAGNKFSRLWRKLKRSEGDPRPARTPLTSDKSGLSGNCARRILVVDDDLIIQRTVSHALEKRGYQVFVAGDVSVALNLIRDEKPDLMLLDLTFPITAVEVLGPVHDGYFVLEWLVQAFGSKRIPIIIISGTNPKEQKAQMTAAGVVAFFQKPLDHGSLLGAIEVALRRGSSNFAHRPD